MFRPWRADVVEHDRDPIAVELLDQVRIHLRDDGRQPRHAAADHQPDAGDQALRAVVGVGHDELVPGAAGALLRPPCRCRGRRGSRCSRRCTPMLRLLPPARLRAWRFGLYLSSSMAFRTRARVVALDEARVVEHAGDRRGRDPGASCDLFQFHDVALIPVTRPTHAQPPGRAARV